MVDKVEEEKGTNHGLRELGRSYGIWILEYGGIHKEVRYDSKDSMHTTSQLHSIRGSRCLMRRVVEVV